MIGLMRLLNIIRSEVRNRGKRNGAREFYWTCLLVIYKCQEVLRILDTGNTTGALKERRGASL